MPFDIAGARKVGYGDTEILSYLRESRPDFDYDGAINSGYGTDEIVDYLNSKEKPPEPQIGYTPPKPGGYYDESQAAVEKQFGPQGPDFGKPLVEGQQAPRKSGFQKLADVLREVAPEVQMPSGYIDSADEIIAFEEQKAATRPIVEQAQKEKKEIISERGRLQAEAKEQGREVEKAKETLKYGKSYEGATLMPRRGTGVMDYGAAPLGVEQKEEKITPENKQRKVLELKSLNDQIKKHNQIVADFEATEKPLTETQQKIKDGMDTLYQDSMIHAANKALSKEIDAPVLRSIRPILAGMISPQLSVLSFANMVSGGGKDKAIADLRNEYNEVLTQNPIKAANYVEKVVNSVLEIAPAMVAGMALDIPTAGFGGSAMWAMIGAGDTYARMTDSGVDKKYAVPISIVTGIAYSAIEKAQVGQIFGKSAVNLARKTAQESIQKTLLQQLGRYGVNTFKESVEEFGQEGMIVAADEIGKVLSGKADMNAKAIAGKVLVAGGEAFKEAVEPMGVLGLVGLGRGVAASRKQISAAKKEVAPAPIAETPKPTKPPITPTDQAKIAEMDAALEAAGEKLESAELGEKEVAEQELEGIPGLPAAEEAAVEAKPKPTEAPAVPKEAVKPTPKPTTLPTLEDVERAQEAVKPPIEAEGVAKEPPKKPEAVKPALSKGEVVAREGDDNFYEVAQDWSKGEVLKVKRRSDGVAVTIPSKNAEKFYVEGTAEVAEKGPAEAVKKPEAPFVTDNAETERPSSEDKSKIINPIDTKATPEEKVKQLVALSNENVPAIKKVIAEIDNALGLQSKYSFKKPENILSKSQRPEIRKVKPWFNVEHTRDSLRFKSKLDNLEQPAEILKIIRKNGIKVIKIDTERMFHPKEWGWRFIAFDLKMPNGQLVEYYAALKELDASETKGPNHALFEKWRNVKKEEQKGLQYTKDILESRNRYYTAWEAALKRLGLEETAAEASWNKVVAGLEGSLRSSTGSKLSLRSSAEGASLSQTPSVDLTTEKKSQDTQILPSEALETKRTSIIPSVIKSKQKKVEKQAELPEIPEYLISFGRDKEVKPSQPYVTERGHVYKKRWVEKYKSWVAPKERVRKEKKEYGERKRAKFIRDILTTDEYREQDRGVDAAEMGMKPVKVEELPETFTVDGDEFTVKKLKSGNYELADGITIKSIKPTETVYIDGKIEPVEQAPAEMTDIERQAFEDLGLEEAKEKDDDLPFSRQGEPQFKESTADLFGRREGEEAVAEEKSRREQEEKELAQKDKGLEGTALKEQEADAAAEQKQLSLFQKREREGYGRGTYNPQTRVAKDQTLADQLVNDFVTRNKLDIKRGDIQIVEPTNEGAAVVDILKKTVGKKVAFVRLSPAFETAFKNKFDGLENRGVIYIAEDSADPLFSVSAHETIHSIRRDSPKLFRAYLDVQIENMTKAGLEAVDARRKREGFSNDEIGTRKAHEEVAADLARDNLSNPAFVSKLWQKSPLLVKKIFVRLYSAYKRVAKSIASLKAKPQWFKDYDKQTEELRKLLTQVMIQKHQGKNIEKQIEDAAPSFMHQAAFARREFDEAAYRPTEDEIKTALSKRGVRGDQLLNAIDLMKDMEEKGGEFTKNGNAVLYHRSTLQNVKKIIAEQAMTSKEDGLFFGTRPTGEIEGYGEAVVRVEVPLEKLEPSDDFANEYHVWMQTKTIGRKIPVKADKFSVEQEDVAFARREFDASAYRPAVVSWAKEKWGDKVAPNGRPTWENFVEWFGDSKVVNKNGEPKVVFHWTDEKFTKFESRNNGIWFSENPKIFEDESSTAYPIFLSIKNHLDLYEAYDKYDLETWEKILDEAGVNTFDLKWDSGLNEEDEYMFGYLVPNWDVDLNGDGNLFETIKASGFDGIKAPPEQGWRGQAETNWIVFSPSQIKSASANLGDFSAEEEDIRFSRLPTIDYEFSEKEMEDLKNKPSVFWHGSITGDLRGGATGLHLGSYKAAEQALEAKIGVPAEGRWDGKKDYGKTLLMGKNKLEVLEKQKIYKLSGYNVDAPAEDYYPTKKPNDYVEMNDRPNILPYRLIGNTTNNRYSPHSDIRANALMRGQIKKGVQKSGFYYVNDSEDTGSISLVVPNGSFVEQVKPAAVVDEFAEEDAYYGGSRQAAINEGVEIQRKNYLMNVPVEDIRAVWDKDSRKWAETPDEQADIRFARRPPAVDLEKEFGVDRARQLERAERSYRGKFIHAPADNALLRAHLEVEIANAKEAKLDEIKQMIYDYGRAIKLNAEHYNYVDTMLKNTRTVKGLMKALWRMDDILETRVQRKLVDVVNQRIKDEYKRIAKLQTGKGKSSIELKYNQRIKKYLDNLTSTSTAGRESVVKTLNYFNNNPNTPMPQDVEKMIVDLFKQNIRTMSSSQLGQVLNDLHELSKLGYLKRELQLVQEDRRFKNQVRAAIKTIVAPKPLTSAQKIEKKYKEAGKRMVRLKKLAKEYGLGLISAERIIETLQEDFTMGKASVLKDAILKPIAKASTQKALEIEKFMKTFREIHKDIDLDTLNDILFMAESDGNVEITIDQAMAIYGHSQNPGNMRHLRATYKDDTIVKAVEMLSDKHKKAVDSIIDYFDGASYDEMNEVFKRMFQIDLPKEARYFPIIKPDTVNAENAIVYDLVARFGNRINIREGSIKGRTLSAAPFGEMGYLKTVADHMRNTIHWRNMIEPVKQVERFLSNPEIRKTIEARDPEMYDQLKSWLRDNAYGRIQESTDWFGKAADFMRKNLVTSIFGLNLVVSAKQFLSLAPAIPYVGKRNMARGLYYTVKDPLKAYASAESRSPWLKVRGLNIEREIAELHAEAQEKEILGTKGIWTTYKQYSTELIRATDRLTAAIVWNGAFIKGINEGKAEEQAIEYADEITRKTQSTGDLVNMPKLYRTTGWARMFTLFTSSVNKQAQILYEIGKTIGIEPIEANLSKIFWTVMVTGMLEYIISHGVPPDEWWDSFKDDPEGYLASMGNQFLQGMPFIGDPMEAVIAGMRGWSRKARGTSPDVNPFMIEFNSPIIDMLNDLAYKTPASLIKVTAGEKLTPAEVKRLYNVAARLTGAPTVASKLVNAIQKGDPRLALWSEYTLKDLSKEEFIAKTIASSNDKEKINEAKVWFFKQPGDKQKPIRDRIKEIKVDKKEKAKARFKARLIEIRKQKAAK